MNTNDEYFLKWFRNVTPYIHDHRGKTFVIMIPGDCFGQPGFDNIISDIAVLIGLGIRLVVVHGARLQIEQELNAAGIHSQFHQGARITERAHLPHVLKAIGGARWQLEALFSSGLPDSPMYGAKIKIRGGNFITAMPRGILDGVDHQMTGKVRSVDREAIREIINSHCLALLSPLGYSITGEVFNLSFAEIGTAVATAIGADKVILFNDDGPIYDKNGTHYRDLTLHQCKEFLEGEDRHAPTNTYFSLRAGYGACKKGVPRAHIISSTEDGTLLKELFTRDGSGTMVYSDDYELVRKGEVEDVAGILNLISPLEQKGILVKRSRELLETEIDHFIVMEKDSMIIGCAALYPINGSDSGELACMAILPEYRKSGRAATLLHHVVKKGIELKMKNIFTLTTQTAHWFIGQGFRESEVEALPASRKKMYNLQRNSKVLVKSLARK
ncbi:amino-acid N-acetyltransferase [Desulfopila sp. IMCC35008]|uniref:amino-acid N-acetyltransferase n=1 Tax=Desulfopila sp. IMCC35008 TaxID=2653858 RepID=UPI0013D4A777|nr:amino-acid N-acetyltransferase [Desulfopila sp. IMCC35008]